MTSRTTTSLHTFMDSLLFTGDLGLEDQVKAVQFLERRLEEARNLAQKQFAELKKALVKIKAENDSEPAEKRQRLDPNSEYYQENANVLPEQIVNNQTGKTKETEEHAKIKTEEVAEGSRSTRDELVILKRDVEVALKNVETKETEAEKLRAAVAMKDAE